jgi:hypothetical protein
MLMALISLGNYIFSNIVLGFSNLDESPINEFNTTMEFKDLRTKNRPFLKIQPSNLLIDCFIDAKCNENCIIAYNILVPILEECAIHDYIIMFHV